MQTEYEVRILEIDKEDIIKRLEELGATKKENLSKKDMFTI